MNYVYCMVTRGTIPDWRGVSADMALHMIPSVVKHTNASIAVCTDLSKARADELSGKADHRLYFIPCEPACEQWGAWNLFTAKIKGLHEFLSRLQTGDQVFVLDVDLIIQDDIFEVFDQEFDIAMTTRKVPERIPINAGVWALRVNDKTREFVRTMVFQMCERTWPEMIRLNQLRQHDQDFLATVFLNQEQFPGLKVVDIGWRYNFCLTGYTPEVTAQIKAAVGDPEIHIVHFKGEKMLMGEKGIL